MFKKGMANQAARNDINKRLAQKFNTPNGYYYHQPIEEHSYSLSIFDGKALLEYHWKRDVDYLDSVGIDINTEDAFRQFRGCT